MAILESFTHEIIIGLVAIVVAGGAITFYKKSKNHKQIQKTGNNSISIQSGRDTNVNK